MVEKYASSISRAVCEEGSGPKHEMILGKQNSFTTPKDAVYLLLVSMDSLSLIDSAPFCRVGRQESNPDVTMRIHTGRIAKRL